VNSYLYAVKIAVNTRFLLKDKLEGFGWFSYETLRRITEDHPEHEFHFFFDRKYDEKFIFSSNVVPHVLYPQARHPILFKWWFDKSVKRKLEKINADIFVSPDGYLSLTSERKQLAVIHDLNFEHYEDDLPKNVQNYLTTYFPKFARKATRIVTVSEFSKSDIVEQYNVSPSKIDVAYNGVSEVYKAISGAVREQQKEKLAKGCEYFIFVGSLHPRKNIRRMLLAFDEFKKDSDSVTKLLIVGDRYWWNNEMNAAYEGMKYKDDVIFEGHMSQKDLALAVGAAKAMIYVSYFEGFGIPLIEAMKAEVPVLTSNKTSLPEVAGDAALIVDPFSIDDIREGMDSLDGNADLRETLIAKGRIRANNFSWDKTAAKLWESIEKCL
jgi:glycosyltransferase involved in cell wall biosynthesis